MTDNDLMPFGKHKGVKMANVPVEYLMWLWDNHKVSAHNHRNVYAYIRDYTDVIETEIDRKIEQREQQAFKNQSSYQCG